MVGPSRHNVPDPSPSISAQGMRYASDVTEAERWIIASHLRDRIVVECVRSGIARVSERKQLRTSGARAGLPDGDLAEVKAAISGSGFPHEHFCQKAATTPDVEDRATAS